MSNIIEINPNKTVGAKINQLEARINTIELAISELRSQFSNLALTYNMGLDVQEAAFRKLGVELNQVFEEVRAEKMTPKSPAPEAPKAVPSTEETKEPA